ncbi:hypothetical protein H8959_003839 [Pygathrix nigripes]
MLPRNRTMEKPAGRKKKTLALREEADVQKGILREEKASGDRKPPERPTVPRKPRTEPRLSPEDEEHIFDAFDASFKDDFEGVPRGDLTYPDGLGTKVPQDLGHQHLLRFLPQPRRWGPWGALSSFSPACICPLAFRRWWWAPAPRTSPIFSRSRYVRRLDLLSQLSPGEEGLHSQKWTSQKVKLFRSRRQSTCNVWSWIGRVALKDLLGRLADLECRLQAQSTVDTAGTSAAGTGQSSLMPFYCGCTPRLRLQSVTCAVHASGVCTSLESDRRLAQCQSWGI